MGIGISETVIIAIIGLVGASFTAICTVIVAKINRKQDDIEKKQAARAKEMDAREAQNLEIQIAQMKALSAAMDLSLVTSYAVTNTGTLNGNVKASQEATEKAKSELEHSMLSALASVS